MENVPTMTGGSDAVGDKKDGKTDGKTDGKKEVKILMLHGQ